MRKLSKNERTILADNFLQLAQLVGDYRLKHYSELSAMMRSRIRGYHKALIDYADFFYATSTNIQLENAQPFIEQLKEHVTRLKDLLNSLQKTQKIMDALGAATRLGASLVSQQPFAVIASMNTLIHKIKLLNN